MPQCPIWLWSDLASGAQPANAKCNGIADTSDEDVIVCCRPASSIPECRGISKLLHTR
jgi:hypothetical protein